MKNIWKWVLGIVLTLVFAAGLFGLGFLFRTRGMADVAPRSIRVMQMERFPGWHSGDRIEMPRGGPMMGRNFGRGPFLPGMMFFGFIGRIIPLALFALLLYGAYRLGKGRSTPVLAPVTTSEPPPPATPPVMHPCPTCGTALQDDWKHCPNCGEKQDKQ